MTSSTSSPFWRDIDIAHTALLLSDVQNQLIGHMPQDEQQRYLATLLALLNLFRTAISNTRDDHKSQHSAAHPGGGPCIIHHVVLMDYATMNSSPYNKINNWALKRLQQAEAASAAGGRADSATMGRPTHPSATATVPSSLHPSAGWNVDEFVLTKQAQAISCRRRC
ncbi:hypothetical protein H2204_000263 [Knufia peltigerae]|uniref:Uncharacterized protein n=1 Tax=Knufia peltigerae TaxID=1002370 RepID=A0AA39D4N8_9EURO|nr:hypothetical protein H2204_000263 [Knufia peltigerae]